VHRKGTVEGGGAKGAAVTQVNEVNLNKTCAE
jgi:hypothetical protein